MPASMKKAAVAVTRRKFASTFALLTATLALPWWWGPSVGAATSAATVTMTNSLQFRPKRVTVHAGKVVRWKNTSDLVHTVTADPDRAVNAKDVHLPPGAKTFNSGRLKPGATFSHRFRVPGTYRYFCIPHEAAGMVAEVLVKP